MRGFAGFDFKHKTLSDVQRHILKSSLTIFPHYPIINGEMDHVGNPIVDASELVIGCITYLLRPKNSFIYVFGLDAPNISERKTDGVVWGSNENFILQTLVRSGFKNITPYVIDYNTIYYINDGEIYTSFHKNERVSTPMGLGTIRSIDEINDICVELDDDKDVYYEFSAMELKKEV